jgi:restriction system protein
MGSFSMSGLHFWETLSEGVGFKAGLALDQAELAALLNSDERFQDLAAMPADEEHGHRFHSSEYEEVFHFVLYKLGRLETSRPAFPVADLHHRYKSDPEKYKMAMGVAELFVEFGNAIEWEKVEGKLDPSPFIRAVFERYGSAAFEMSNQLLASINAKVVGSPWSRAREINGDDEIELRALFRSEGLIAPDGPFVDQRYIDFLHRNFERIDQIHWRKFEGLTAEFFQRDGYDVQLGPGRGDGGIDLRVWSKGVPREQAPTILVQCKRQKDVVERVVMKALYADVEHEKAASGLIVTTSRLSPGAHKDRIARGYPIEAAERQTVREWIAKLREPGAGYVA